MYSADCAAYPILYTSSWISTTCQPSRLYSRETAPGTEIQHVCANNWTKQQRPKDWKAAIKSGPFKTSSVKFLVKECAQELYLPILNGHTIYLTSQDEFSATEEEIIRERIMELDCSHQ